MKKFILEFSVENDTFTGPWGREDDSVRNDAVAETLERMAKRIRMASVDLNFGCHIYDVNGNQIGDAGLQEDED